MAGVVASRALASGFGHGFWGFSSCHDSPGSWASTKGSLTLWKAAAHRLHHLLPIGVCVVSPALVDSMCGVGSSEQQQQQQQELRQLCVICLASRAAHMRCCCRHALSGGTLVSVRRQGELGTLCICICAAHVFPCVICAYCINSRSSPGHLVAFRAASPTLLDGAVAVLRYFMERCWARCGGPTPNREWVCVWYCGLVGRAPQVLSSSCMLQTAQPSTVHSPSWVSSLVVGCPSLAQPCFYPTARTAKCIRHLSGPHTHPHCVGA